MMNEKEAWTSVYEVLEMLEGMPPRTDDIPEAGLCGIVVRMGRDGIIDIAVYIRMLARIQAELDKRPWPKDNEFLFKPYLWKPRAKLARRFAKECEE